MWKNGYDEAIIIFLFLLKEAFSVLVTISVPHHANGCRVTVLFQNDHLTGNRYQLML